MKTVIIYASVHHRNTKKLVERIAEKCGATLIDVMKQREEDLSEYDRIGFASGIYLSKFGCKGYDTFGPFKLVGSIAKGHPNEKDLEAAINFITELQL